MGGHLLRRARPRGPRDRPRARGPRHRAGRQGRDPREHPPRVDHRLLRDPDRRRRAGHDLPDELGRGVPVRPGPLGLARGVRGGRRSAGQDPRGPRPLSGAASRDRDGAGRHRARRRALTRRAAWARRRPRRGAVAPALRGRDPGRRVPVHLHLGHHRSAEGLPALARELPRDHRRGDQGQRAGGRRQRLPLPPASARLRDPDPVHRLRAGRHARLLVEGRQADHPGPHRGQAELLPVGPSHVREDLHAGHERGARPQAARPGGGAGREGAHGAGGRRRRAG